MNILSLFDGMSCSRIALIEAGIPIGKYYASEIDQHAIKQTQLNFPDTIQLGDVQNWKEWTIRWNKIDIIFAGSPCQGFSLAGKRLLFDDPRSKLFFVFVDILNYCRERNPNVKFLLENVDMASNNLRINPMRIISEYVGIFPVNINSNLVSAQNRSRWYWSDIRTRSEGLLGITYTDIPQPKDQKIMLKDVLEEDVPDKYYLSEKMLHYFDTRSANFNNGQVNVRDEEGKASTITASCKAVDISDNFIQEKHLQLWKDKGNNVVGHSGSGGQKGSIYGTDGKMSALCATDYKQAKQIMISSNKGYRKPNIKDVQKKSSTLQVGGHGAGNNSNSDLIIVAQRGRGENNEQQLEPNFTGKTNSLTSVQKDNLVVTGGSFRGDKGFRPNSDGKAPTLLRGGEMSGTQFSNLVCIGNIYPGENNSVAGRVYTDEGKSVTLSALGGGGGAKTGLYNTEDRIRRLTPTECARLQTIPDWYNWEGMSDTQRYKCLGNGWTIKVITHILSFLNYAK